MGLGAEALGATADEGAALLDLVTGPKSAALVDQFLQSDFGDPAERDLVAAAAAGVVAVAETLGFEGRRPEDITATVDLGFRFAKAAYKAQTGELSGMDAALELVEDRIAAHVGAWAGVAVEQGLPKLGATVGAFIESHVPMGGVAVQAGHALGSMAGKALRPIVSQAVRKATRKVLKAGRQVLGKVASAAASTLKRAVFGLIGA